jgi:hypothetical protein
MWWRYNADGFLVYSADTVNGNCFSYVQLFHNGCLEYGDGYILNLGKDLGRENQIPSKTLEVDVVNVFENALEAVHRFEIEDPVYFSATLMGVQGKALSREGIPFHRPNVQHSFDRQIIQTPEVEIDRTETRPYHKSAMTVINAIWQAGGYEQTPW